MSARSDGGPWRSVQAAAAAAGGGGGEAGHGGPAGLGRSGSSPRLRPHSPTGAAASPLFRERVARAASPPRLAEPSAAASDSALDAALSFSSRARREAVRAASESEAGVGRLFGGNHDLLMSARSLVIPLSRALSRLAHGAASLEHEAAAARSRIRSDADALVSAGNASVSELMVERDMLARMLESELRLIEAGPDLSIQSLQRELRAEKAGRADEVATLSQSLASRDALLAAAVARADDADRSAEQLAGGQAIGCQCQGQEQGRESDQAGRRRRSPA